MDALARHETQVQQDGPFFAGAESGHSWWSDEFYRLAKGTPGPVDDEGFETDLFAGLT
jgi:N-acetyl-1-D-myo-inositol-2-amino-2-deoxy-alpha-D-glucopyranoside deacetylase